MNSKNLYLAILLTLSILPGLVAAQTQIKSSADSFRRNGRYSATAYFSGKDSSIVIQQNFTGSDLRLIFKAIDSVRHEFIAFIDNVVYIDSAGRTIVLNDIPYNFNNGNTPGFNKGLVELNFEKLRTFNFISGVVFFAGTGFPTSIAINAGESKFLHDCYEKTTSGTTITFEGCVYKNQNGVSSIVSKTIKL